MNIVTKPDTNKGQYGILHGFIYIEVQEQTKLIPDEKNHNDGYRYLGGVIGEYPLGMGSKEVCMVLEIFYTSISLVVLCCIHI